MASTCWLCDSLPAGVLELLWARGEEVEPLLEFFFGFGGFLEVPALDFLCPRAST